MGKMGKSKNSTEIPLTAMGMKLASILLVLNCCVHSHGTLAASQMSTERLMARNLDELRVSGWSINGPIPTPYGKPSEFKTALRFLDTNVTGDSVWKITSYNPTRFRFKKFMNGNSQFCDIKSVAVHIKYFSKMAMVGISPCKGGRLCYADSPENLAWVNKTTEMDIHRLGNRQIEILVHMHAGADGYILFDQIGIEFEGTNCSLTTTTTEASTTAKHTTTTENPNTSTTEDYGTPIDESEETTNPTTNWTTEFSTTDAEQSTTETTTTEESSSTPTTTDRWSEEPTEPTDLTTDSSSTPTTENDWDLSSTEPSTTPTIPTTTEELTEPSTDLTSDPPSSPTTENDWDLSSTEPSTAPTIPTTTEELTQPDLTTDSSSSPTTDWESSTEPSTESSSESTTASSECPTTTPPPQECNCCDRCHQTEPIEVHHHYHYYYNSPTETI